MYSDSDDPMSDSSIDLPGQEPIEYAYGNPLSNIHFNEDIHRPISRHLSRWHFAPFTPETIKSDAARVFYTSFFLGVLTTYESASPHGLHSTYHRSSENKLEIAAVFVEGSRNDATLHIHEIAYDWSNPATEVDEVLRIERIQAVKEKLQSHMRDPHDGDVTITKVLVHQYQLNERPLTTEYGSLGVELKLTNRVPFELTAVSAHVDEADAKAASEYIPVKKAPTDTNELWEHFVNRVLPELEALEHEPSMEKLSEIVHYSVEAVYSTRKRTLSEFETVSDIAASELGFLHGALFKAMPNNYYERQLRTDFPAVHYTGEDALLYFGSSYQTPHKHLIVDLDTRTINFRHSYIFAEKLKELDDEAEVEEIRYIDAELGDIGHMTERTVRWDLHNVITNLILDVQQASEHHKQQITQDHDVQEFGDNHVTQLEGNYYHYSKLMQDILSNKIYGDKTRSLQMLKAFLFGQLVTNMDVDVNTNRFGFQISSADGQDIYHIGFSDEQKETNIQELIETHEDGNRFLIDFTVHDGQIGWHVTSFNPNHVNMETGSQPISKVNLRDTLRQVANLGRRPNNDVSALRRIFHGQLQGLLQIMKYRFAGEGIGDSFLAGALSNMGLREFYSYANQYGTMMIHSALSLASERLSLMWMALSGDSQIDRAQLAIGNVNNEENTFTIVNSLTSTEDTVEVAASSSKQRQFNTDNVNALCQRFKRNLAIPCKIGYEEIEEKVDYADIHERARVKYPVLSEHLSILHQVSGNLQMAFIARDILGDLYRKDMDGFQRDVLFFGIMTFASEVGHKIAAVGQSLKASGKTILGGVMETVGGCAAMVGFDLYMGYQMKEELDRNDTESAIYTGAYIGMDLIECGAIAAAAFGLTPFLPVIAAVISVFRVFTLIAQNVQETNHKIQEIEAILPLTPVEESVESLREFLHLGMDPKIESMVNEVTANEAVVHNMVEKYPKYSRYLTSAASKIENKSLIFIDDNTIDLTKTYLFNKSTLMPRHGHLPENVTIFCSMNEADNTERRHSKNPFDDRVIYQPHPFAFPSYLPKPRLYLEPREDFLCKNAFGIEKVNEPPERTLYLLYNGTDDVVAFPTGSNVFLLMNGKKSIQGGLGTDIFAIKADKIFGYLNGSAGDDTVDFSASDGEKYLVIRNGEASFIPTYGNNKLLLYNIETVIGRSKLCDYIEVCGEERIDLGGTDYGVDSIEITNNCPPEKKRLTITLRNKTVVSCDARNSAITYIVTDGSDSDLFLDAGKHELLITSSYFDMIMQPFDNDSGVIEFPQSNITLAFETAQISNITFQFQNENLTMKLDNQNNITLYLHGLNNIFDVVEKYAEHVEKNQHVKLIAKGDYGAIVLRHSLFTVVSDGKQQKLNMISNGHKNTVQMIGHSGVDNYFWISAMLNKTINITIHPQLSKLSHCYIDLHNLTREMNRVRNGSLGLFVRSQVKDNDIILNIFATSSGMKIDDIIQVGTIKIINSVNYMRQITVYLYGRNVFSKNARLEPVPILTNQTFLTVLPGQIEFESQIHFNYPAPNLTAYRMDASLFLTNVVSAKESSTQQPVTIVLSDYFTYRAKYETLSLIFDGHVLDVGGLSRFVQNIKAMWKGIKDALK